MLLTETCFETSCEVLTEGAEKNLYIVGPFLQADVVNRNRRIYPSAVMDPAVDKFINEFVKTNRAVGELEHPDRNSIHSPMISHLITEVTKDGSDYIGKAKVLGTPMGDILRALLEGGVQMGVSSRGTGSTKKRRDSITEVCSFDLRTVDAVYSPSAPDAFVSTLVESEALEQIFQNNKLLQEFEEFLAFRKMIKESKKENRHSIALVEFEKLLKTF